MQALGLIETKGLIAAVESADAMLKAADVSLLEKTKVGGGLVSIAITGDVGAVKAAVDAGAAAVIKIDRTLLVSQHVIPRPHEELNSIIGPTKAQLNRIVEENINESQPIQLKAEELTETQSEQLPAVEIIELQEIITEEVKEAEDYLEIDLTKLNNKEAVDRLVLEQNLEKALEELGKLKVIDLRNLARKYSSFGIAGRKISKADKKLLLIEFRRYYESN